MVTGYTKRETTQRTSDTKSQHPPTQSQMVHKIGYWWRMDHWTSKCWDTL